MKPNSNNSHKTKLPKELTPAQVKRKRNKTRREEQLDRDIARSAFRDMFGER